MPIKVPHAVVGRTQPSSQALVAPGVRGVRPAAFGAAIGAGLGLLADVARDRHDKSERFTAVRGLSNHGLDLSKQLAKMKRTTDPSAENFFDMANAASLKIQQDFLLDVPAALKDEFHQRAETLRVAAMQDAFTFEYTQKDEYYRVGLDKAFEASREAIRLDPSEDNLLAQIDSLTEATAATDLAEIEQAETLRRFTWELKAQQLGKAVENEQLAFSARSGNLITVESGGSPTAFNPWGFAGTYQFGAPQLTTLGLYKPGPNEDVTPESWNKSPKDAPGKWSGTFNIPGFPEVKTLQDFLQNPAAQNASFDIHEQNIEDFIDKNNLGRFEGETILGTVITRQGMHNVAHLGGNGGLRTFLTSGGSTNEADRLGTRWSDYMGLGTSGGKFNSQVAQRSLYDDLPHALKKTALDTADTEARRRATAQNVAIFREAMDAASIDYDNPELLEAARTSAEASARGQIAILGGTMAEQNSAGELARSKILEQAIKAALEDEDSTLANQIFGDNKSLMDGQSRVRVTPLLKKQNLDKRAQDLSDKAEAESDGDSRKAVEIIQQTEEQALEDEALRRYMASFQRNLAFIGADKAAQEVLIDEAAVDLVDIFATDIGPPSKTRQKILDVIPTGPLQDEVMSAMEKRWALNKKLADQDLPLQAQTKLEEILATTDNKSDALAKTFAEVKDPAILSLVIAGLDARYDFSEQEEAKLKDEVALLLVQQLERENPDATELELREGVLTSTTAEHADVIDKALQLIREKGAAQKAANARAHREALVTIYDEIEKGEAPAAIKAAFPELWAELTTDANDLERVYKLADFLRERRQFAEVSDGVSLDRFRKLTDQGRALEDMRNWKTVLTEPEHTTATGLFDRSVRVMEAAGSERAAFNAGNTALQEFYPQGVSKNTPTYVNRLNETRSDMQRYILDYMEQNDGRTPSGDLIRTEAARLMTTVEIPGTGFPQFWDADVKAFQSETLTPLERERAIIDVEDIPRFIADSIDSAALTYADTVGIDVEVTDDKIRSQLAGALALNDIERFSSILLGPDWREKRKEHNRIVRTTR